MLTLQPNYREQQFERIGAWCLQFSDHANNVRFKHFYGRRKRAHIKVEDRTIIREPRVYVRAKHANSLQIGKGRNRRACSTGTHLWVIFATNEAVATSAHGFGNVCDETNSCKEYSRFEKFTRSSTDLIKQNRRRRAVRAARSSQARQSSGAGKTQRDVRRKFGLIHEFEE